MFMQFMHPKMKFWNVTFALVQTPVSKYSSQHVFHILTWWVALINADFVGWDWFCCSHVWSSLFWIWKQHHTKDSENLAVCVFSSAVGDSMTNVLQSHSQVHCNEMTLGNSVPSSACCWKSWIHTGDTQFCLSSCVPSECEMRLCVSQSSQVNIGDTHMSLFLAHHTRVWADSVSSGSLYLLHWVSFECLCSQSKPAVLDRSHPRWHLVQ